MAINIYKQNELFLKENGIELISTNAYGVPFQFINNEFKISLCEYSNLFIKNKITLKEKTISMVYELLEYSDLGRN